jgi:ketosteroid isomerase-like protein
MTVATDNITLLREGYDEFAHGDLESVFARFSPELEWTLAGPAAIAGTYRGHDGVMQALGKIMAAWPGKRVEPLEFLSDGEDRVVVLGRHVLTDGTEIPFAHAWRIDGGLAASFHEYVDTEALQRTLS